MSVLIKILFLFVSTAGSWEWLRRRFRVNAYFLPALTIAVQVTLLFCAGLLNFLYEASLILYIGGIVSFVYYLFKDKIKSLRGPYFRIGFLFLLAASAAMLFMVRGREFAHIDNFTHWALVVKDMLRYDRFPNFSDKVIKYQAYPLGSSVFVYYFARMAGGSEPVQMFAQIYMMLACILPLFIFSRKNKVSAFLIITAAANFFFVYNILVTNLLVDTLLPLAGMCGLLYVYFYGKSTSPKPVFYASAFFMIWVMQIKNSGAFFVFFMALYILWNRKTDGNLLPRVLCAAAPLVSWFLWHKHFLFAFTGAERSKNAFTFSGLTDEFLSKSQSDIDFIVSGLLKFTLTWADIRLMLLLIILTGILVLFVKQERRNFLKTAVFCLILFAAYQIALLGTYIFSMDYFNNNGALAAVRRYDKTIVTAVIYLLIAMIVKAVSEINAGPFAGLLPALAAAVYFCGFMQISLGEIRTAVRYYNDLPWDVNQRIWLERNKESFVMEEDDSYCILTRAGNRLNYLEQVGHYVFFSENVRAVHITDKAMMDEITEEFIIINEGKNRIIKEWVEEHYPEQAGNTVIRRWDLYP